MADSDDKKEADSKREPDKAEKRSDGTDEKSAAPKKKGIGAFLFPMILVLVLLGLTAYYFTRPNAESTDDAAIEGNVTQLASRVAAQVNSVEVQDNQTVKQGDVLVTLDKRDFEVRVEQTAAQLESARAKVRSSREKSQVTERSSFATQRSANSDVAVSQTEVLRGQTAVETAEVAKSQAQNKWIEAKREVDTARRDLGQSEAAGEAMRVEEVHTYKDLLRYQNLYAQKAISTQQLDNAKASHDTALANYRTSQERTRVAGSQLQEKRANQDVLYQAWRQSDAAIREAQARVAQANTQVEGARLKALTVQTAPEQFAQAKADTQSALADVLLAKANYDQALLNLSYCTIKAPINGRIARRSVDVGNYVAPGQALLSVIADERWAIGNFKETQLTKMKIGQHVKVEVDAYPQLDLRGRVDSFQPGTGARFSLLPPENASGNWVKVVQRVPIKVTFDKDDYKNIDLAPGMSVTITVDLGSPTGNAPNHGKQ